jgi:hypothetical protein
MAEIFIEKPNMILQDCLICNGVTDPDTVGSRPCHMYSTTLFDASNYYEHIED